MAMDKKVKARWIKALLSGKFKQAKDKLVVKKNKRNSYCCLGVLARVQGAQFVDSGRLFDIKLFYPKKAGVVFQNANYLEGDLACGLDQTDQGKLSQMNDDGKSFKEIAAWIKKNL